MRKLLPGLSLRVVELGDCFLLAFSTPARPRSTERGAAFLEDASYAKLSDEVLRRATDAIMERLAELGGIAWDPHITPWTQGSQPQTGDGA